MFDAVNSIQSLTFVQGDSAEDLLKQLRLIRLPVAIVAMYAVGSKHIAWIKTDAKLVKKAKKQEADGA